MKFTHQWFQRFEHFFFTQIFIVILLNETNERKKKFINDIEKKKNYLREFSIAQWKA